MTRPGMVTRALGVGRGVYLRALLSLGVLSGCSEEQEPPAVEAAHGEGEDHDAEMARDAEAALQRSLAEAAGKPPVITPEEVIRRTGVDSLTAGRLTPRVPALNAALVRLAELHRAHDSARVVDAKHQIDRQAYTIHLEADTYENDIHALLTEEQHRRFHAYLAERAAAVGLPIDRSHGTPGVGTLGSPQTVGHPQGQQHGDTAARTGRDSVRSRDAHEHPPPADPGARRP
jgi:hypothetical protein